MPAAAREQSCEPPSIPNASADDPKRKQQAWMRDLLNHAAKRAPGAEGALAAAKWLIKKRPGLYSMRDLMNFK